MSNDPHLPFATLPEWFEHQARATPESVAVVVDDGGEKGLTYAELNGRANQLARRLERLGVGPDKIVAVCLDRSLDLIVGLLGIMKAGGAYLPIDRDLPRERQAMMLDDALPTVLLTQELLRTQLPSTAAAVLVGEAEKAALAGESPIDVPVRITSEKLAYLMYTSGSTGTPKGVEIPHRALVNFLASMQERPGLTARDVLVAITTVSFDIAGLEIFLPLVTGARLIFLNRDDVADGFRIIHHLKHHQATVLQATPSAWRMLLDAKWPGNPSLKMLCGGEGLPRELANQLLAKGGELWNMYGPTETTIWSAVGRVGDDGGIITIGQPVANTQLHILDAQLQPVPPGVPGELHIGGLGLARGYRNRPELTAERFIPDPFSTAPGARLYKTGDLARSRSAGQIEVQGRIDHQVKIRGFRIELGEIEARLSEHPAIKECVVVAHELAPGRKQLVAYLVAAPGSTAAGSGDSTRRWREHWNLLFKSALKEEKDRQTALLDFDTVVLGWTDGANTRREAQEWLECSLARIRALKPQRVLELGCGSGQLLLRLADECDEYWGIDYLDVAIEALEEHLQSIRKYRADIHLLAQPADRSEGLPPGHFDTIVINSVAQYFPDADYLVRVIENAVRACAPNGKIYLGDLQSFQLLECYHAATRLHRATAGQSVAELQQLIAHRLAQETELMVDPPFFRALQAKIPAIRSIEAQLRRGTIQNEITQFHYDIVLHLGDPPAVASPTWYDWDPENGSIKGLAAFLRENPSKAFGVRDVPNGRLQKEAQLQKLLGRAEPHTKVEVLKEMIQSAPAGIDPEELWALGASSRRAARVLPNLDGSLETIDVIFGPAGQPEASLQGVWEGKADQPSGGYVSQPHVEADSGINLTELRAFLAEKLPDYMLPSFFEILPALPLTANGKINRKALPAPRVEAAQEGRPYVAPQGATETRLAEIWAEVLGRERVGTKDDIFEIGGDSLLIFRIAARANEASLPLTVRQFFQYRTIAELAAHVQSAEDSTAASRGPSLVAVSRETYRRAAPSGPPARAAGGGP